MLLTNTILLALAIQASASPIEPRQGFHGNTQNGLSGNCMDYTVIYARGTNEGGNVGLIGPSFFQALATKIRPQGLAVQGVDYTADVAGFRAGGDPAGSKEM